MPTFNFDDAVEYESVMLGLELQGAAEKNPVIAPAYEVIERLRIATLSSRFRFFSVQDSAALLNLADYLEHGVGSKLSADRVRNIRTYAEEAHKGAEPR